MKKNYTKFIYVLLLIILLPVFATGCSNDEGELTGNDENQTTESNDENLEETFSIGISVPVLSNPFWRSFADFGEVTANELGMDVTVVDANQNDSDQLDQIMGLVSSGVDGIIITPNTSDIALSLLEQCESAGVKVIFAERYPGFSPSEYDGDSYVGYIGVDNTLAGYNIAASLYESGSRQVVAVGGVSGVAVADERSEGLHKFLEEHPDMELLQEMRNAEIREQGLKNIEDFLSAYPDGFDGVWCYNDDTAMGVLQGLTNAGLNGEINVAGMDLIDEAVDAIKAGDMLYSTGGQWTESAGAAIMLFDALNGHNPDPDVYGLEIPGVTEDNVDAYAEQFVDNVPEYDVKKLSKTLSSDAKTTDFVIELK